MAGVFLYLTTTGRRSGLPRRIEIWFIETGGAYYVVAEMRREAGWVKNLERDPQVSFSVGTRGAPERVLPATAGHARFVDGPHDVELLGRVSSLMHQKYGWSDGLVVELTLDS